MAAFTSKADGDWHSAGQTTWNEVGVPDGADDTAAIATGHDITAAAAVVCGAVTVATGATLVAQGAANTITSVVMTGTAQVTLGATTMAGVLTNSTTGTLTTSGAITGVTNFSPQMCTLGGNVTMTDTLTGPASGRTFAQGGNSLTGFTADIASFAGTWTAAGAFVISGAKAGTIAITTTGTISWIGTALAVGTVENTTAGQNVALSSNVSTGQLRLEYVNLHGTFGGSTKWYVDYVQFTPKAANSTVFDISLKQGVVNHFYVGGVASTIVTATGMRPYLSPALRIMNGAVGYLRDGSSNSLTTGIGTGACVDAQNILINATTPVASDCVRVIFGNYGHVDSSMCAAGSALEAANGQPGVFLTASPFGTTQRSTTSPKTGETYLLTMTPSSIVTATYPLVAQFKVPVVTGDLSVQFVVPCRRTTVASTTPITLRSDPEVAWVTSATHTPTLTDPAGQNWYNATLTTGVVGGTAAKGMLTFQVEETGYTAAGYVDLATAWAIVTHADSTTTRYTFSFQNGAMGMVLADKPDFPAVANVWFGSGTYNDGNKTPTKRASSIANCTAGNVKNTIVIDDVTGTYHVHASELGLTAAILKSGETVDDVLGTYSAVDRLGYGTQTAVTTPWAGINAIFRAIKSEFDAHRGAEDAYTLCGGRLYRGQAPPGAASPYIVMSLVTGELYRAFGGNDYDQAQIQVDVWDEHDGDLAGVMGIWESLVSLCDNKTFPLIDGSQAVRIWREGVPTEEVYDKFAHVRGAFNFQRQIG